MRDHDAAAARGRRTTSRPTRGAVERARIVDDRRMRACARPSACTSGVRRHDDHRQVARPRDHLLGPAPRECGALGRRSRRSARRALPSAKARIGTTTPARASRARATCPTCGKELGNIGPRMLPTVSSADVRGRDRRRLVGHHRRRDHRASTRRPCCGVATPSSSTTSRARTRTARYLAGIALPAALRATTDLDAACTGADVVVMAVPSHGFRAVLERRGAVIGPDAPVVSLSKGIERGTLLRMTEVIARRARRPRRRPRRGAHRPQPRP